MSRQRCICPCSSPRSVSANNSPRTQKRPDHLTIGRGPRFWMKDTSRRQSAVEIIERRTNRFPPAVLPRNCGSEFADVGIHHQIRDTEHHNPSFWLSPLGYRNGWTLGKKQGREPPLSAKPPDKRTLPTVTKRKSSPTGIQDSLDLEPPIRYHKRRILIKCLFIFCVLLAIGTAAGLMSGIITPTTWMFVLYGSILQCIPNIPW